MAKIADLAKYLNDNKIQYQVIAHDPAFTAHDVARATHVPDSELAKAIIVRAGGGFWMGAARSAPSPSLGGGNPSGWVLPLGCP